jgi:pantoate--beta-alanine ligase
MSNTLEVWENSDALRAAVREWKKQGLRVGFVPTMGYLHEGHISLVELAKRHSDRYVVSIFVNPTQFNDPRDLEKYPRDLPRDLDMLRKAGTHGVFFPTPESMYAPGHESWVELSDLPLDHEGAHRPGHFRGVTTVVSMLFNLVQPDIAVFGEKDFQQLRIIERMVDDLKFPVDIIRGPLVRESDGLAMSSRNVRLQGEARTRALHISKGLFAAQSAFAQGERVAAALREIVLKALTGVPELTVEYVEVVEETKLTRVEQASPTSRVIVAAMVSGVRLIDNISLGRSVAASA